MSDLNTEIRIGADASGVETGVSKAKKSLASLGAAALQAGRDAAKGVGSIGEGGDKSARQVESATKSIVSSLQRQIAAFEAGGRGTRAYQESLARIRGVDVSALKPLLDQLDASKAKAQAAATANVQLSSSYAGLSGAALSAGRVLAAIGIGVSVREFIQMADASTNVASRLSLVTDSAAELIAVQKQLFTTAQSSRVSFVDLAQTYSQMSRATKELGVSQNDMLAITKTISQAVTISGGSAQSAQAALIQLSQGFAAGALRGEELNSIMEQTPRLAQAIANGLGVGIGKLREMGKAGELTAEAVLGALQKSAAGIEAEFARMTPTVEQSITKITNSMLKLVGVVDSLFGATSKISGAFSVVSQALDFIGSDIEKINSQGALREAASQVLTLDQRATQLRAGMANGFYGKSTAADLARVNEQLAVAKVRFNELNAAANGGGNAGDQSAYRSRSQSYEAEAARQSKLATDLNNVRLKLSGVPESYVKDMKEIIRLNQAGVLVGKEYTDALKKQQESLDKKGASSAASAIKEEQNAYESLISSIRTKIESESLELAGGNTLAESQKIRIKLDQELASGKLKLSAAHRAVATAALEELAVLERRQLVASAEKAYDAERAKTAEEISAAYVTESKAREQGRQSVSDYVQAIEDQNKQTQFEIGLSGKTTAAREVAIRQYRIELDLKKQIEAINRNPGFDESQREEERIRARAAAAKAAAGAESAVYLEEWQKTSEAIESSITDALLRGFESGKGFAENLRTTIVNMFKTMVLRPVVNAVVNTGTQAVGQALGFGGQQQGGGGLMGLANNANSLNSLYSAGSQFLTGGSAGASAASLGYANAIGAVGGDAIGALATANGGWAGVSSGAGALTEAYGSAIALEAGTAAGTAGAAGATAGITSALAAVPVWGWVALAGIAILGMSGKGGGPKTESGGGYGIGGYMNSGGPTADYAKGIETGYAGLAQQLGLTSTLSVGAFSSQDKEGDSQTQLVVSAGMNGQSIYDRGARLGGVENVGRSDEELQAAMAEEATRVMIAALKSSDLEQDYKDFLNTVSESATAAALESAVNRIIAVKGFKDAIEKLPFENLKELSFAAADGLIAAAGGLQALSANLDTYYQNFYSAEEQRAQVIKNLFSSLGAAGVDASSIYDPTLAGFRKLVDAQDVTTASGQKAYAALLSVSGAFAQLANTGTAATEALKQAIAADGEARKVSISGLKALSDSLKSALESLSGGLSLSDARAKISAALATAKAGGGLPTAESLSPALKAVTQADTSTFASALDYKRFQAGAANDITELAKITDAQLSLEQQMLDALLGINKNTLSVAEALGAVNAEKAATAAQAAQAAAAGLADQQAKAAIAAAQASAAAEAAARAAAEAAARAAAAANTTGGPLSYLELVNSGQASFAVGTNYVPRDMKAQIHQGERIIPAADNRELMARLSAPASDNAELVAEIRALRSEVANLRSAGEDTARSSRKTADTLVNVTRGGNAMLTEAA